MSICKKHVADPKIRKRVVNLYRSTLLTMQGVARKVEISHHSVCHILKEEIASDELKKLKALKYSESKRGDKNPCFGKKPTNFRGDCSDGRGYFTRAVNGKRKFSHRIVFANLLNIPIERLNPELVVHHIDENPHNNNPDNLALCTNSGHRQIHERYIKSDIDIQLGKLTLAEAIRYLSSK